MQPLAIAAIALGAVMIIGVSVALVLTRHGLVLTPHGAKPSGAGLNRWQRHGSAPLAAAGLTLGVISRININGLSPTTHNIVFAVAITLLLGGLICALFGAAAASHAGRGVRQ